MPLPVIIGLENDKNNNKTKSSNFNMEQSNQNQSESNKIPRKAKPLFYFIAIILPFVILASIEWSLRLIGIGKVPEVFVEAPISDDYLMPNPDLVQRYFSHPELAANVSPDTVYFQKHKPKDTYRIVIQGGSTAAGFPFGRFGSLQGMLEQRLKATYPDAKFEIINTAMAAVNTFTLIDIQDEILALEPDAVLIYTGHNEYLGILGAGSVFGTSLSEQASYGATLLYLKLKKLHLFNALEHAYASWVLVPKKQVIASTAKTTESVPVLDDDDKNRSANLESTRKMHSASESASESKNFSARTTMAKAAQGQAIEIDSATYKQGLMQYQQNLSMLLDNYQKANVPVFIGNLVSIEKGLAPFSSVAENDPAGQAYKEAEQYFEQRQFAKAKTSFVKAKDLDLMRFRAPSDFNEIVESLVEEANLQAPNSVQLVNVESAFRQNSKFGVLGTELFYEHVHPNKKGYFLLADAFFDSLTRLLPFEAVSASRMQSDKEAYSWAPVTELADAFATLKIHQLTKDYPFVQGNKVLLESPFKVKENGMISLDLPKEVDELLIKRTRGESWWSLQNQLLQYYLKNKQIKSAAIVAGIMADAMVVSDEAHQVAARYFRQIGALEMARFHQQKALEIQPENIDYLLNLAFDFFMVGRTNQSLEALKEAQRINERKTSSKQQSYRQRIEFFINKVSNANTTVN